MGWGGGGGVGDMWLYCTAPQTFLQALRAVNMMDAPTLPTQTKLGRVGGVAWQPEWKGELWTGTETTE